IRVDDLFININLRGRAHHPPLLHLFTPERHSESVRKLFALLAMARREDRSHPKPQDSCTIEFDGASRGNPGRAGAGAVLRAPDNTVLFRSREGLGSATNNVAEYRALNLGLETALNNGFRNVRVQGDSQLVCKQQVQGEWATRHPKMAELCGQAHELMSQFDSCDIQHVPRAKPLTPSSLISLLTLIHSVVNFVVNTFKVKMAVNC
ncbi:unnamed protein product, partial [Brassica napus]